MGGEIGQLAEPQKQLLNGATVTDKNGWRHLCIEGNPRERGFQHGYLLAAELEACLRSNRFWAHWLTAQSFEFFINKAEQLYLPLIKAEFIEEMEGIAEGAQAAGVSTSFGEIFAWNCFVDLIYTGWSTFKKELHPDSNGSIRSDRYVGHRCSAFIANGDATSDGRIVMAHNTWDAYLQAQHFNVVIDITPDNGNRMVMQTAPGWIASMMDFTVTAAGLMVTETTIGGYSGFDPTRPPEFYASRNACQYANGIDEWVDLMEKNNNGGYANSWLLGDTKTNEIARCEIGLVYQSRVTKTGNGVFYGENIPSDLRIRNLETSDPDAWSDISGSGARRVRWKKLLAKHHGVIDVGFAQEMIGDHFDEFLETQKASSRSLCGHIDEDNGQVASAHGHPPFYPWGAVDGKVADTESANAMGFHARWGRACGQEFDARRFLEKHPQYDWLEGYLLDRPRQPWSRF